MSTNQIANRLADAIENLSYAIVWLEDDPDTLGAVNAALLELRELKLDIEMAPFRREVTP